MNSDGNRKERVHGETTGIWDVCEELFGKLVWWEFPGIHKGELLVMGAMEPKLAIFYNQVWLPTVGLENQPSQRTLNLQSVLPTRCAGALEGQNFWSVQPMIIQLEIHARRGNPHLTLPKIPWVAKNLRQSSSETQDRTKLNGEKKSQ